MNDGKEVPVTIASRKGFYYELKAGKRYLWCSCGRSKTQPFCDGSHKGTEFTPKQFKVEAKGQYWLCACKHSANPPYCDGAHELLD